MNQSCLNAINRDANQSDQEYFDILRECYCRLPTQSPEYVLKAVFLVFILIVTFLGNSVVCLAVLLYRRMRTLTNYFIVSLALSDLLLSLLSLPFRIDQTIHNRFWCKSLALCQTWILVDLICSSASMWNLAAISIDRFIAIVLPFRYHTIMTTRVGIILISFVWVNSLTWALLALLNWTAAGEAHWGLHWSINQRQCSKRDPVFYTVAAAFDFFLPLAIVIVMYTVVFVVAWSHARAVAALQQAVRQQSSNTLSFVRELKAAKTLAIVIGTFVICWFPFFVLLLTDLWSPNLQPSHMDKNTVAGLNYAFFYVLPVMNSTLNPLIYTVYNKNFRSAFKKLFTSYCAGRDVFQPPMSTERKNTQLSYDTNNDNSVDRYETGRPGKKMNIEPTQVTETIELSHVNS